jgi:hypothetical protein
VRSPLAYSESALAPFHRVTTPISCQPNVTRTNDVLCRVNQKEEEIDASEMEKEHQSAVELWNDLQSQSDRVGPTYSATFASISHPASLRFLVSKAELASFSRVLALKKLQLSTRATIPCPVVGVCGATLPLCFIRAKARTS